LARKRQDQNNLKESFRSKVAGIKQKFNIQKTPVSCCGRYQICQSKSTILRLSTNGGDFLSCPHDIHQATNKTFASV